MAGWRLCLRALSGLDHAPRRGPPDVEAAQAADVPAPFEVLGRDLEHPAGLVGAGVVDRERRPAQLVSRSTRAAFRPTPELVPGEGSAPGFDIV